MRALADMPNEDLRKVTKTVLEAILPPENNYGPSSGVEDNRFTPPKGFRAFRSLEQGDCFFSSLSQAVYGSDSAKDQIRLGIGLFGFVYVNDFVEKFIAEGVDSYQFLMEVARDSVVSSLAQISDQRELLKQVLLAEAQQTLKPSSYSGFLQVLFSAGYLQRTIKQYQEYVICSHANPYTTLVKPYPKWCAGQEENVYIMWVRTGDSIMPNHVVPLQKIIRGRVVVDSPWDWTSFGNGCKALNFGWCTCKADHDTFLQCVSCHQKSNPECLGISQDFIGRNSNVPYMCCGDMSDIPNVVITQCKEVYLHMSDILSVQPGRCLTNWVIDFCIYTSGSHDDSANYGYLPTTAWEVAANKRNHHIKRHRNIWRTVMEKPVVLFVVAESGHFLAGAFLQMSHEVYFLDSMHQNAMVYKGHSEKLKRLFDIENKEVTVHCVPTQQQSNGVDCGVHTFVNLLSLMKIFRLGVGCNLQEAFSSIQWQDVTDVRRVMKVNFLQHQI
ncbi:uncharacterized protein LOC117319527 [Pecten maximus]|uniref:uncharacterized protein LOC117319527 n=1 Tax=Pecten maximus TaxID=6579 RepID=UPI001458A8E5|nr:uncharacterized protein LOC117319527 [Pecten maximus]XP_033730211.1 uncharacterized protein LOC117319527 [Pecten maximus]XP_033730212.1 uncharacterized protein LOC117319527 [Pecten maximus]